MSLYGEDPGNRPASPVLPDAVGTERDRRMLAGVEEKAGAHLGIAHEVSGRETGRGDLGLYPRVLRRIGDGDHAAVTLSLTRTVPNPNVCLVTNVTDDPAGSMAYRPAGAACTAVLVVDMTAVPS
jgi:hypothetical protein